MWARQEASIRLPGSTESRLTRQITKQTNKAGDTCGFSLGHSQVFFCIENRLHKGAFPCTDNEADGKSANSRAGQGDMLFGVESNRENNSLKCPGLGFGIGFRG